MFLKLHTSHNEKPIYINFEHVTSYCITTKAESGTETAVYQLHQLHENDYWCIKETPEEITKMLSEQI